VSNIFYIEFEVQREAAAMIASYERGPMLLVPRPLIILLVVVAVIYILICAALFAFQRSLIYYPQPRSSQAGITLMTLPVGADSVLVSTRPNAGPDAVIYFGGNAEDVSQDMPDFATTFPNDAIYLLHYPGYGGSSGKPTEQSISAAALSLYDRVHAEHPNIVVVGRSLGTGVAVRLASQRCVSRLVLVTPYDSLTDPAVRQFPYFPVRLLALDRFDSWKYAPKVTAPTRIIVAEEDEIIPRSSTERLRTRFSKDIVSEVVVPGVGHNSISDSPNYWSLLKGEE
jgi:pimeloyl-ACP methyl ester carboxylesterase